MSDEKAIDLVRLSERECHALLDRLDGKSAGSFKRRRAHARHEYRIQNVAATIMHQGGRPTRFLVCARNLSEGGMAFLHGGFLYAGTECTLTLQSLDGKLVTVEGEVRSCRHAEGHLHEVGVKFRDPINPEHFCRADARVVSCDGGAVSMKAPRVKGTALIISSRASERSSLSDRLAVFGIQCSSVADARAAAYELMNHECPLVICECSSKNFDAAGQFAMCRDAKFTGPIVAIGGERELILLAGATAWVARPLDMRELLVAIEASLGANAAA